MPMPNFIVSFLIILVAIYLFYKIISFIFKKIAFNNIISSFLISVCFGSIYFTKVISNSVGYSKDYPSELYGQESSLIAFIEFFVLYSVSLSILIFLEKKMFKSFKKK